MKTVRRQNSSLRETEMTKIQTAVVHVRAIFIMTVLAAFTTPTFVTAANVPTVLSNADMAKLYYKGAETLFSGGGKDKLFDGDETTGAVIANNEIGAYLVLDFGDPSFGIVATEKPKVFVDSIDIVHGGNARMSLWTGDIVLQDGTTTTNWTPVADAQNVQPSTGITVYKPKVRALLVKYVFESSSGTEDLFELRVKGWLSSEPHIVSEYSKTKWYNADGSAMDSNGGGGKGNPANVFNGIFGDYQMFPRCNNNGYFVLDLTADFPNGCYFENVIVDTTGDKAYSILYSEDGSTWKTLVSNVKAAGATTYNAGYTAKQIKYVFVNGSMWDYSTEYFAEFQVWGMDANDLPCTHQHIETVSWSAVPDSATCTAKGLDERFCPDCGERFTKISDDPPLGHDYVSTLARPGSFKRFGSGSITCSRCDYRIDFTNTPETDSTNGPIDLVTVGGLAMDNLVQFTDLSVTSTDHQEWGPNPANIIGNSWVRWWISYWVSAGLNNQHADFDFGTEIDLTQIQIVLHNLPQTILFFDVDDDTGEETQLKQFTILRTDVYTNAADLAAIGFPVQIVTQSDDRGRRVPYRFYPGGENGAWAPVLDYGRFGVDFWDSLVVTNDLNIPTYYTNPDGSHPMHQKKVDNVLQWEDEAHTIPVMEPDSNDNNQFQSFIVRFYEQPCKHLRIRNDTTQPTGYQLWSGKSMSIIECHPWGIVRGAGETRYRKETIMIFK